MPQFSDECNGSGLKLRKQILDSRERIADTPVMAAKANLLSVQIRAAIGAAGVTRYRIAKDTGISESMLSRFMSGSRGLSMEALDVLGEYLGLEIRTRAKRPSQKGK
jgi:hypothetical protein